MIYYIYRGKAFICWIRDQAIAYAVFAQMKGTDISIYPVFPIEELS